MNTCKNCIHKELCKDMHKFGVVDLPYNDNSAACEHYKNEEAALHTLRLIYADFMEAANRLKVRAEECSLRGVPHDAYFLRSKANTIDHLAYRVQSYCYKIGFDPTKGETT